MIQNEIPVLVTGGAGYIGSHVCKALRLAGFLPIAYDNLTQGSASSVQWGPLEEGDIRDEKALSEVFLRWNPTAVLHFAGLIDVAASTRDPLSFYEQNVAASITLCKVMRSFGVATIVFSSSCATYGVPQKEALDEEHVQLPVHPYGRSKWMIEQLLNDLHLVDNWRVALLRYFNAAGADPEGRIGEAHSPETHLIPLVIQAALHQNPVSIFGTDYPTSDGTAVRDYIHVDDLAEAHVLALQYLLHRDQASLTLNLGSGKGYSVQQVVEAVERVAGCKIPTRLLPRRSGDVPILVANSTRAFELLRWKPRYDTLESIVETAYQWYIKNPSQDRSLERV